MFAVADPPPLDGFLQGNGVGPVGRAIGWGSEERPSGPFVSLYPSWQSANVRHFLAALPSQVPATTRGRAVRVGLTGLAEPRVLRGHTPPFPRNLGPLQALHSWSLSPRLTPPNRSLG